MDSVVKIYGSINDANNALNNNLPMSAILAHDGMVHIPFHPVGREGATRSSVSLLKLKFLDSEGYYVHSMCWMAPLKATEHTTEFTTIFEIQSEFAKEFILLLPKLHDHPPVNISSTIILKSCSSASLANLMRKRLERDAPLPANMSSIIKALIGLCITF